MAEKSLIDIEVNAASFRAFSEAFDKYSAALKASREEWARVNNEIGQLSRGGGHGGSSGGQNFFKGFAENFERGGHAIEKISTHFRSWATFFRPGGALHGLINLVAARGVAGAAIGGAEGLGIRVLGGGARAAGAAGAAEVGSFDAASGLFGAGLATRAGGLARLIPGVGAMVAGGAAAVGGLVAATAPGVADARRRALGLGTSLAEQRAFGGAMTGTLGDPGSMLSGLNAAQFDITSPERAALNQLFGARGAQRVASEDRTKATFETLEAMRKKLATYKPELRGTMARSLGMTNLIDFGDIQAWSGLSEDERKRRMKEGQSAADTAREHAKAVDTGAEKMTDLARNMGTAEASMKDLATIAAGPVASAMTTLAKDAKDAADKGNMLGVEFDKLAKTSDGLVDALEKLAKDAATDAVKNWALDKIKGFFDLGPLKPLWDKIKPPEVPRDQQPGPVGQLDSGKRLAALVAGRERNGKQPFAPYKTAGLDWLPPPEGKDATKDNTKATRDLTEVMREWTRTATAEAGAGGEAGGGGAPIRPGAPPILRARGTGGGAGGLFPHVGGLPPKGGGLTPEVNRTFDVKGSTVARGNLKQNQQEAYAAAKQAGLSDTAARALVANMSGEALGKPGDVHWDVSHYAHGIVQWDDTRSKRIAAQFGQSPEKMSVADQTKAAIWEMKSYYPTTWKALQSGDTSEGMVSTLVRDYERPADKASAIAARIRYLHGLGVKDTGKAAPETAAPTKKPADDASVGPMAMNNWQQPDRRNRFTVNSNFGADIAIQAATLVS